MSHVYRFHCQWPLAVAPEEIYAVLADVPGYPSWWPQVLSGRELADGVGELRVRSALPYELTLRLSREVEDPELRVLRARLDGDLVGWTEWEIEADGDAAIVHFREEAALGRRGLSRLPVVIRPILTANHNFMMRGGERGLRQHFGLE